MESCKRRAGSAATAWPKKGEVTSPTKFCRLTLLKRLKASAAISSLRSLWSRTDKRKDFETRLSASKEAGPWPVLRVTPGGRSLNTVSLLLSVPVVMLNGGPEYAFKIAPKLKPQGRA